MANSRQPALSQWQPCENQYFIKDEPDYFSSQDSGVYTKSEADNSLSEEYDASSLSVDSGYLTSFNMSNQDDSIMQVELDSERNGEVTIYQSPSFDVNHKHHMSLGLVKIENCGQSMIKNASTSGGACVSVSRPFGFYGHMPVHIQPKPSSLKNSGLQNNPPPIVNQAVQQAMLLLEVKGRQTRSRKSTLIVKIDEYQPEEVKPSQELLAARRFLEEALITGNIVSQARNARLNRRLDKMRVHINQITSVRESFSQERFRTVEPARKRSRTEEKSKCSRVLYQENRRLPNAKFTWKIGIHGPHKSFNRLSVKKSGKKKRRSYLNRQPLMDISDDSDDNARSYRS